MSWLEQLESIWKKMEIKEDFFIPSYSTSIEDWVKDFSDWSEYKVDPNIITFAAKVRAKGAATNYMEEILDIFNYSKITSPIEQAFLVAFEIISKSKSYCETVLYRIEMSEDLVWDFGDISASSIHITVEPQKIFGKYRVDFLIRFCEHIKSEEKKNYFRIRDLIVECDGHDFHERTKEQASRDRKKDRYLQELGYKVYRFTGSDIWKNPFECAEDVLKSLTAKDSDAFPFKLHTSESGA